MMGGPRSRPLQNGGERADNPEVSLQEMSVNAVRPDPTQADDLRRSVLFGLQLVDAESLAPVLAAVLSRNVRPDPDHLSVLVTPNVDIIVMLDGEPDSVEADVFRRAQYVLPDGMPLVATSRFFGPALRARLTGSGLFELLWPRLAAEERPTVVVCADDELRLRLSATYPGAGFVVPPFFDGRSDEELGEVADLVMADVDVARTEYVLIGLGHPKDALLANEILLRWPPGQRPPLILGLGGSFAMYAGLTKRAPDFVQRIGAEWLYRFVQEPGRLFTRYFVRDIGFFGVLWREYRGVGRIRRERQS